MGSGTNAVPEVGAPMLSFEYGQRLTRMGVDEPRVLISDREAPASQKWSYAVGAREEFDVSGTTDDSVPVHVAGREARGPTEMYCADAEVALAARLVSSSAFIREIRGKAGHGRVQSR